MDFVRPVETIIPGVQGRVLGVLSRNESEMTIRMVARLADVSAQQASVVVTELVRLGVISRREAGSASLIGLERSNETAQLIIALAHIDHSVTDRLRLAARQIKPAPASLVLFGSFVRGEAVGDSDLDVFVVRPRSVKADDRRWIDSLGEWEKTAQSISGNRAQTIVVGAEELPALLRRRSGPWRSIAEEGIVLIGNEISNLTTVA